MADDAKMNGFTISSLRLKPRNLLIDLNRSYGDVTPYFRLIFL